MSSPKGFKFDNISDLDLEKELERRKSERNAPPEPVKNPDFTGFREMIINTVKQCVEDQHEDEDIAHFIYEAAMKVVYGEKFFEWHNKQDW